MILKRNSVAVVLAVYNQKEVLEKSLRLWPLVCTRYGNGSELIICDDGSDDGTEELIAAFMEQASSLGLRVVYLRKERGDAPQLSANINQAKDYVSTDYVLFAMGDSYPNGLLLDEYAKFLEPNTILTGLRQNIGGVFNHSVIKDEYRSHDTRYNTIHTDKRPWEVFTGNNCVFPKWMLDDLGWWNEGFQGYGAEDEELAMLAHYKLGAKFRAVKNAKVFHVEHPARFGSGDPDYFLAQWVKALEKRYSTGNYNRSTARLKPRPPK